MFNLNFFQIQYLYVMMEYIETVLYHHKCVLTKSFVDMNKALYIRFKSNDKLQNPFMIKGDHKVNILQRHL